MRRAHWLGLLITIGIAMGAIVFMGSVSADEEVVLEVQVENQDGERISGADVTVLWDDQSETDTTLPDGTQTFVVPDGAGVTISVDDDTYVRNFPLEVDDVSLGEGESRYQVTLPVYDAGSATITVEEDGEPIEDLRVRILDRDENSFVRGAETGPGEYEMQTLPNSRTSSLMTNEEGVVVMDRLAQKENYRVDTFKPGYIVSEMDVDVTGHESVTIDVKSARVDVDFFVTDGHFEPPEPLAEAQISIPEAGVSLTTFSDGGQDQRLPVNTDYEVEVSKEGYDSVTRTLELGESSKTFNTSIERTPRLNIDVLNAEVIVGQTVRVTVTNAYDEPLEGVFISLDGDQMGRTDATGSFDVTLEEEGVHTITADHEQLSEEVSVEAFDPGADDIPEDIEDEVDAVDEDEDEDDADDADDDGAGFGFAIALGAVALTLALLHYPKNPICGRHLLRET